MGMGMGTATTTATTTTTTTGKMIISNSDYEELVEAAILKATKGTKRTWVKDLRKGRVWKDDDVEQLSGVGPKKAERLRENGIESVGDVFFTDPDDLVTKTNGKYKRIFFEKLRKNNIKKYAGEQKPSNLQIDHRKQPNPYKSKFGDEWKSAIARSATLRDKDNIRNIVEYMIEESRRIFNDGKCDWHIYHDALSLFVSEENVEWMKSKMADSKRTYFDVFIFPQNGLSAGIARYGSRPVGNSPEFMAWDCSLNKDVDDALRRHVVATAHLDIKDPRKFSMRTPREIERAIFRLMDPAFSGEEGVPTASRIREDCMKVLESYKTVVEERGRLVEGLGNRTGRRAKRRKNETETRGGARTKNVDETLTTTHWYHPDAVKAQEEFVNKWGERFKEEAAKNKK